MLHQSLHCIQYWNDGYDVDGALFSIFSGPLFANVEGYVYLDLMIWGLSPLVFLTLKSKLTRYFKKGKNLTRPATFKGMIFCILVLCLSYPFLNYSQDFNWNYFSRTFNLDMGYFVFDFIMRTLDVIKCSFSCWSNSRKRMKRAWNAKHTVAFSFLQLLLLIFGFLCWVRLLTLTKGMYIWSYL